METLTDSDGEFEDATAASKPEVGRAEEMNKDLTNLPEPEPFLSEEERERIIEGMKKVRIAWLNFILLFPSLCAMFIGVMAICVIFVMDGQCSTEKALNETFNGTDTTETNMDMTHENSNDADSGCSNNISSGSVELFLCCSALSFGAGTRCFIMAWLYHQIQTSLERKHLAKWIALTALIITTTAIFSGKGLQIADKDNIGREIYLSDHLKIIFYFTPIDAGFTLMSLIGMDMFTYTDAVLEKELEDALEDGIDRAHSEEESL